MLAFGADRAWGRENLPVASVEITASLGNTSGGGAGGLRPGLIPSTDQRRRKLRGVGSFNAVDMPMQMHGVRGTQRQKDQLLLLVLFCCAHMPSIVAKVQSENPPLEMRWPVASKRWGNWRK